MNKNFLENLKKTKYIYLFFLVVLFTSRFAAQTSLEMTSGAGNPTGNGPVQSTTIYLQDNTNNPSGNTFSTPNNALSVDYVLQNYAYAYNSNPAGNNFIATLGWVNTSGNSAIFPLMNFIGSSTNTFYTAGSTTGSGIDSSVNRSVEFTVFTSPFQTAGLSTSGRFRACDLVLNFSRPVDNPILHFTGLGGVSGGTQTFSAEFNVLGGYTLNRLSGIDATGFVVENTNQINNNNSSFNSNGTGSGTGSVRVVGNDITTLTIEIYLNGSGGATWTGGSSITSDAFTIGVSAPQNVLISNNDAYSGGNSGTTVTTTSVLSNDTFNGAAATTSNVTVSGVTVPSGFTVNANGTITKNSSVAAGTYTITYQICDNTESGNCKTATATITVTTPPCNAGTTSPVIN